MAELPTHLPTLMYLFRPQSIAACISFSIKLIHPYTEHISLNF